MSAPRVLHLIPSLGGGGAERQLALLAPAQAARGMEVHVASLSGGVNQARLAEGACAVHRLRAAGNHDPRLFLEVAALVRRLRPDVVQTWITQMDVVGGAAARLLGTPWVLSERSGEAGYVSPTLKMRARCALAAGAAAVAANSLDGARYWARQAPRVPRVVIANGLPLDEIAAAAPLPEAELPAPGPRRLLFVGRLYGPEKDPLALVAALRELGGQGWGAIFCGDGPDRGAVEAAVAEAGLAGRVTVAGYRDDVWRLLKSCDLLVSTSRFEGSPNAVLEAMAAGCPLVVSDIAAHRELLDESTAWLADAGDPRALAAALSQALADPAEARARAARAFQRVRARGIAAAAERYEMLYRAVAKGATRGAVEALCSAA